MLDTSFSQVNIKSKPSGVELKFSLMFLFTSDILRIQLSDEQLQYYDFLSQVNRTCPPGHKDAISNGGRIMNVPIIDKLIL